MIKDEYVTLESAKLLKEAGFPQDNIYLTDGPKTDDPLYEWYDNRGVINLRPIEDQVYWNAPTPAQAMRWLREEKHISVEAAVVIATRQWDLIVCSFAPTDDYLHFAPNYFPTYEAAAEAGIQAACRYLIEKGGEQ